MLISLIAHLLFNFGVIYIRLYIIAQIINTETAGTIQNVLYTIRSNIQEFGKSHIFVIHV